MKKTNQVRLPKIKPADYAKDLRKQFPKNSVTKEDRALWIASGLVKHLEDNPLEEDTKVFTVKEVKKSLGFWREVKALLSK